MKIKLNIVILSLVLILLCGCSESKPIEFSLRYVDTKNPVINAKLTLFPYGAMFIPPFTYPSKGWTDSEGSLVLDIYTISGDKMHVNLETAEKAYYHSILFIHPYYHKDINWILLSETKLSSKDKDHREIEMQIKLHGKARIERKSVIKF